MIYSVLGKYDKALEEGQKVVAIDPDFAIGYLQLAFNHAFLGELKESDAALARASERKLEIPEFLVQRYDNAFLRGDKAEMDRQVALSIGKPGEEDWLSHVEGLTLAHAGRLQEARAKSQRAVALARQSGELERASQFQAAAALWEGFVGNTAAARQGALTALGMSHTRDAQYGAALALALSGDSTQSERLATDLEARFPEDTIVRFSYVPELRALHALKEGLPDRAVDLLHAGTPYELGVPPSVALAVYGALYPVYLRGMAYLAGGKGPEAVAEFQKILAHREIVINDPIGALARVQLGRAFVLSGDRDNARKAYQDFFTLWAHADSDIPILQQARTESTRLR
jgi:tetratricopeptide (TPR) repeat protein